MAAQSIEDRALKAYEAAAATARKACEEAIAGVKDAK